MGGGALGQANERIQVVAMDRATISASNLERSTRFYARLFGFSVVHNGRGEYETQVIMAAGDDPALAIRARGNAEARRTRLTIRVADLDAAREALWNQGVVPAVDGLISAHAADRCVVIEDPDGHEIELVEHEVTAEHASRLHDAQLAEAARIATVEAGA